MEISYQTCTSIDAVINLHKQIFGEDNPTFFKNLKTKAYYKIFTASQNKQLVAYCIVTEIAGEGELINIGTLPNFCRKGIAYNLLTYAISKINCSTIFLEVSTKNIPAINLYKKCGFISYSIRKNYYGDSDAILMKLQK